ncbi:hypothetical protein [Streptomyces erythrochromogenes]|uniref:hypothetical protein n=1 Tax=Streptomyces erythrochromogenes TaxID=285574 RepID=UPI00367CBCBD
MPVFSPVDCADALGVDAPECITCEGVGTEIYLHGPHEQVRECEDCRGIGRRLDCPACEDGATRDDDTCPICDGFGALF